MQVEIVRQISGLRDGEHWPRAGATLTVSDTEGAELCAQGVAKPVTNREQPETREAKDNPEERDPAGRPGAAEPTAPTEPAPTEADESVSQTGTPGLGTQDMPAATGRGQGRRK